MPAGAGVAFAGRPLAPRASGSAAGVQRLGLRDPERRHGGREQRRQHLARPAGPCQVTSQVIVAVAWNAPPGCPALELV
ncbi:MAG TPA: hypothetical protein VF282_08295 [Bacillota bacterium]